MRVFCQTDDRISQRSDEHLLRAGVSVIRDIALYPLIQVALAFTWRAENAQGVPQDKLHALGET